MNKSEAQKNQYIGSAIFDDRQNVGVVVVKPGKEAVDNRIKGILGNLINQENRGRIFIISHDHGYYKLINRYRTKYGIQAETLDLKKSIQAAL